MKPLVLSSTGAFVGRPNGRNHKLLYEVVPRLHADGYEFMMYDTWYSRIGEVVQDLQPLGMLIPVFHVEKSVGHLLGLGEEDATREALERFRKNLWAAGELGAGKLVLHLWNGPSLDEHIERNLDVFPKLWEMAKKAGLLLTVENVVTYGAHPDHPLDYMREIVERVPEAAFTYDLKMAAFHGQNARVWDGEWRFLWEKGRVAHLHVSDYGGGLLDFKNLRTRHLGEGNIDFASFFRNYNRTERCDTVTLECLSFREDGGLEIDAMNQSIEKMRVLLEI